MYAVIETGGKQYRVEVGSELEIEQLAAGPGETVSFDRILLIAGDDSAAIGTPIVANASVSGEVVRRERGEKLISFKYRPKARRRVKKGHRQELTVIRISDIVLDGKSAAADVAEAEKARRADRAKLEEAARRQAEADAALAAKLAADKQSATADRKATSDKDGGKVAAAPTKEESAAKPAGAKTGGGDTPAKTDGGAATAAKPPRSRVAKSKEAAEKQDAPAKTRSTKKD